MRTLGTAGTLLVCLLGTRLGAVLPPPPPEDTATNLMWWSFNDTTNWTDDLGYAPLSFTNLAASNLGNGSALVLDTNVPAWLNFNLVEPSDGRTNLTLDIGSLAMWFAPSWAGTNSIQQGTGPGQWGRILVLARLPGAHAEITALQHAAQNGLTPQAIGVTRAICPECEAAIRASGGTLTSPTTAVWPR